MAQRLGGSNFGLGTESLAWTDHGSMARITTQWLRGSDLETVLDRDLSSMVRWLGSISAHKNRIKQLSHFFFLFFFSGLLTSTEPRADVITGKAARVKVTSLNSGSRVKPWHGYPLSEPAPAGASGSFW